MGFYFPDLQAIGRITWCGGKSEKEAKPLIILMFSTAHLREFLK